MVNPPSPRPPVTVVVATRDRPAQLETCLASIRAALHSTDELIVVDSASRQQAAVSAVAERAGARLVRCERPGVNLARNAGWRAGSGSLVLFTDDDVVVDPHWVDAFAAAFAATPETGFFSGRILPPGDAPSRDVAIKRDTIPAEYDGRSIGNLGHGASLAIPRNVLERIGGWDEAMGSGGRFGAAPENDLFDRCFGAGLRGRFEPAALAYHEQWRGPRRLLLLDARYGFGSGARLSKLFRTNRGRAWLVARDSSWNWGLKMLAYELRQRHGYPAAGVLVRLCAIPLGFLRASFEPVIEGHFVRRGRRHPS